MKREFMRYTLLSCLGIWGCATTPEIDAPKSSETAPSFAVLSSDYTATSLTLLDAEGKVLTDNFVTSGSATSGLVTALSGDVVLPTRSGQPSVLTLLDRLKTDVVTRIAVPEGKVLGQVKAEEPAAEASDSAYSSNPQDYVYIDAHRAWLSRAEPNLDPNAKEIDRGTDLLLIDPGTMQRGGERIDLSMYDTMGTQLDPDTQESKTVHVAARPSGIVRVGQTLVVGLARTAFDFSAAGQGAVALVNLDSRKTSAIEFDGLKNCGSVVPVAGSSTDVLVGCLGFFGDVDPAENAGIVLLRVSAGKPKIVQTWRAMEHPDDAISVNDLVSLGGMRVAAVAFGQAALAASAGSPEVPGRPDRLSVLDLARAEQTLVFEAQLPYALGAGAFDANSGLLLIPDASVDANKQPTAGVHRFKVAKDGTLEDLDVVKVAAGLALPARQITAF
jgi:hypothetical protein